MTAPTIQTFPDRASWLAARRLTIGSSDAPIILGLGHRAESGARKSLLSLWAEKRGLVDEPEQDSVRLRAGHYLERPTEAEARFVDGSLFIEPFNHYAERQCPHEPVIGWATLVDGIRAATPDLMVLHPERPVRPRGAMEVKTVEAFAADDWTDGPSAYSLVQLHHQLIVGGWSEGWIAAWIGFGRFELHHVEKDPELTELILEREDEFWRHVQQDIEPRADASESASRTLRKLHPRDSGEVIRVESAELAAAAADLLTIKAKLKDLGEQELAIENALKQQIGDATELVVVNDGEPAAKFSWKYSSVKPEEKPRAGYEKRTLRKLS
jgi:predicted phage-related endonuclease